MAAGGVSVFVSNRTLLISNIIYLLLKKQEVQGSIALYHYCYILFFSNVNLGLEHYQL